MTILRQLGKRIKYLRDAKKMSQLDLELVSGVNRNYISDLENGRRNVSILVLEKIAIALDVDLSTLLKGIQSLD